MNTLIVGPAWVGDMVMAQPLAEDAAADGIVHVVAPAVALPIAARMPGVTQTHCLDVGHGELALGRRRALAATLRQVGFDRAYVLPNSFKSALLPWLARVPRRIGWRGELRYGLLNDLRTLDPAALPRMIDRFNALGAGRFESPRLRTDAANRARLIEGHGLAASRAVALCPGAEFGPAKRWPAEHFAALANVLAARGREVWLIGSPADRPTCAAIAAAAPARNLAGETSLGDAVDLLAAARCVVSNDSGLMHVAAAVGTPVVALFGSTSPDFTPPLSPLAEVLVEAVPCRPCFARVCRYGHLDCLTRIEPARVAERVDAAVGAC